MRIGKGLLFRKTKYSTLFSGSSENVIHYIWASTLSGWEASTSEHIPKTEVIAGYLRCSFTENADISKLFAVAVRGQGEQKGPFEAHEAPHTGQVETLRVT